MSDASICHVSDNDMVFFQAVESHLNLFEKDTSNTSSDHMVVKCLAAFQLLNTCDHIRTYIFTLTQIIKVFLWRGLSKELEVGAINEQIQSSSKCFCPAKRLCYLDDQMKSNGGALGLN